MALDCISVEDVFLHCKHITTSKDDLASFSQYGLLSLKGSLSKDTSLRRFLLENEIEIDMEQMTFSFKGKTIYLHDYSSDCIACHYGECKHRRLLWNGEIDIAYKNTWCNFREKTRPLSLKLYHDKAEIEVHLSGDNHDVHDYSCVKRCPEILLTINTLVKEIYKQDVSLPQKWALQQSRRYYCLSFDVNIRDFEFITTDAMYDRSYYMPYLDFCRTQYDTLPERNINFYGNVFLLSKSMFMVKGGM